MYIRRFNESAKVEDISLDRVGEISTELSDMSDTITRKNEYIDLLLNELDQFRSRSEKKVDQVDEVITNLQLIKKDLSDALSKIDTVVNNLDSYKEEGRKELF
jgi:ABC-type transporter Mla subunit MlaD